jgi:hypothetical protein
MAGEIPKIISLDFSPPTTSVRITDRTITEATPAAKHAKANENNLDSFVAVTHPSPLN